MSKHVATELEAGRELKIEVSCNNYSPIKAKPSCNNINGNDDDNNNNGNHSSLHNEEDISLSTVYDVQLKSSNQNQENIIKNEMNTSTNIDQTSMSTKTTTTTTTTTDLFSLFFYEVNQIIHARLTLCELTLNNLQLSSSSSSSNNNNNNNMKTRPTIQTVAIMNGLPLEDIPAFYSVLVYLAMIIHPNNCSSLIDICLNATADALNHVGLVL